MLKSSDSVMFQISYINLLRNIFLKMFNFDSIAFVHQKHTAANKKHCKKKASFELLFNYVHTSNV